MEERYDQYAASALMALISKFPLVDRDGEFSKSMDQTELQKLKRELCRSAHEYAMFMIEERYDFINHLRDKFQ